MGPENYVVKGVIRVQIKGFTPRWSRTMNTEQILVIIILAIISRHLVDTSDKSILHLKVLFSSEENP